MRSERDMDTSEEGLNLSIPQISSIWDPGCFEFEEFRKSSLPIRSYIFAKTHGNQGVSSDMSSDQHGLDKEGEFGLCGAPIPFETEAVEHPGLLHIPNHV